MHPDTRRTGRSWVAAATAGFLLIAGPTFAATIWLTLDEVTVDACDEVWHEAGVPMWFSSTTADDFMPIGCDFVADANAYGLQGVHLGPGRLVLDVSGLENLQTIHMDIYEEGSTIARMMDNGVVVYTHAYVGPGHQTMFLPALGGDMVIIAATSAYVGEIRLSGEYLPVAATTFSAMKALYSR